MVIAFACVVLLYSRMRSKDLNKLFKLLKVSNAHVVIGDFPGNPLLTTYCHGYELSRP